MAFKKIFTVILISAFSSIAFAPVATFSLNSQSNFTDVKNDYRYFTAIDYVKREGIVQGYADRTFKPGNSVNRAEFLKMVVEAAGETPETGNCYNDVKEDVWYAPYVCKATKRGWVNGYSDGTFRPEKLINFAEASKILVNVLNLESGPRSKSTWYEDSVLALENIRAIPKNISSFNHTVTRGETAEMLWRIKTQPSYVDFVTYKTIEKRIVAAETNGQLQNFDSCAELKEYLEQSAKMQPQMVDYLYEVGAEESAETAIPMESTKVQESSDQSVEYSTTNIQVEGVDEADFVKTDGKNIYIVKNNTIRVVRAYPPNDMIELEQITFDDTSFIPAEMYVDSEHLVVIGASYQPLYGEESKVQGQRMIASSYTASILYERASGGQTIAYIFNVSDGGQITLQRRLAFEGDYSSSRKVDQIVYLVINKAEYSYIFDEKWNEENILPLYNDSRTQGVAPITKCNRVRYFPGGESTNYIIIAGISLSDADSEISEQVVLGSTGALYASRQNLYVAEPKYEWYYQQEDNKEETIIHKFNLGKPAITYLGKNSVPGHILNQFSMDEFREHFRIATTQGQVWDTKNPSQNNVYILDKDLNLVGSLEGIAPGETIYSVRFMGERAYMVTFKKVDPFFVIDASDPKNPKILGKLKIPGFSDYLHPFDENHIIGFGKEAIDASETETKDRDLDFAWYQGMKVAMFDVTDVSHPIELHKLVIGDRGTNSPLLYDHKALLFDKEKNIMAFPVTLAEIPENVKNDPKTAANTYGDFVYQGAYILTVNIEDGFQLRGRITHYDEQEVEKKSGYSWYGDKDIARILYIDDYLYTVSQAIVKANNFDNLENVNTVILQ